MKLYDCDQMNSEKYERSSNTFKLRNRMIENMRYEVSSSTRSKLKSILIMNDARQIEEIDLKAMVDQMAHNVDLASPEESSEIRINSKRMILESIEEEKSKFEDSSLARDELPEIYTTPFVSPFNEAENIVEVELTTTVPKGRDRTLVSPHSEEQSDHVKAVNDITMWLMVV